MCLGAHSVKTPVRLVKQLIVFHWMPQKDWYSLVLVLTSMWKSCGKQRLVGELAPRSGPLINRLRTSSNGNSCWLVEWLVTVCTEIKLHLPLSLKKLLNNVASALLFPCPSWPPIRTPDVVFTNKKACRRAGQVMGELQAYRA